MLTCLAAVSCLKSATLTNAVIVVDPAASKPQQKAAQMLSEEIAKRTQIRLKIAAQPPAGVPSIQLRRVQGGGPADGFRVTVSDQGIAIEGNDDRGVVFGAGYLLRKLTMGRQRLEAGEDVQVTTAPKIGIRGHQLGYRPKTNAYDAWSVPMWEQYIRELAIFGTNTIELIPPRSDDDADSPHFPLPPIEMMVEMSRIANEYGLDVSIWYPAMDRDYSDPKTVAFALGEWAEVFRRLPRIDAIFVPGGDPGHTQPKHLLALLERQTESLHKYHPKAGMWVSPQSFSQEWMDEFYSLLDRQPKWLSGVVFGPQVRGSIADLRARVPKRYPVRFYPDITHSIHAEFPVPDWDFAFAATEGREGINPRPLGETTIFRKYRAFSDGFVTYSEGCNDDVNKFVWSSLGWDPDANVTDILRGYSRFFFGMDLAPAILALERNWTGPLLSNTGVDTTLQQFQQVERAATPQLKLNWRFQELLYRAYYDAFLRGRLLAETGQEERALGELRQARAAGSLDAMDSAERTLATDPVPAVSREYRARVFESAEALFQSIHMQLSVPRYQAIAIGRGANLDAIDFPLNNRVWLRNRFKEIRTLATESERLTKLDEILNWTNPGPGGYYDDLGNPAQQPHLVLGEGFARDPDFLKSALVSFGDSMRTGWRTSWYTDAESLYEQPLRMHYTDLDPAAAYRVRIVYGGDMPRVPVRLTANGKFEIHGFRAKAMPPQPVEFEIPVEATRGGTLDLEWSRPAGLGGNGRGCQVSEVWLMRR